MVFYVSRALCDSPGGRVGFSALLFTFRPQKNDRGALLSLPLESPLDVSSIAVEMPYSSGRPFAAWRHFTSAAGQSDQRIVLLLKR